MFATQNLISMLLDMPAVKHRRATRAVGCFDQDGRSVESRPGLLAAMRPMAGIAPRLAATCPLMPVICLVVAACASATMTGHLLGGVLLRLSGRSDNERHPWTAGNHLPRAANAYLAGASAGYRHCGRRFDRTFRARSGSTAGVAGRRHESRHRPIYGRRQRVHPVR